MNIIYRVMLELFWKLIFESDDRLLIFDRDESCNMNHQHLSNGIISISITDRSLVITDVGEKMRKMSLATFSFVYLQPHDRTILAISQVSFIRENIIKIWAWENVANKWMKVKKVKFEDMYKNVHVLVQWSAMKNVDFATELYQDSWV